MSVHATEAASPEIPSHTATAHVRGAGWHIDSRTLMPTIDNLEDFRREFAHDEARDALEALWLGDTLRAIALIEDLIEKKPHSPRFRALLADAHRDQGRIDTAVQEYRALLDEVRGTSMEAVISQHLGKALFAGGRYMEALNAFSRAYELRVTSGATDQLVMSSEQALSRTHDMIEMERRLAHA